MKGSDMVFPADIKGCMKDCILSLFWPRKDIVGFFEKHGCTKSEVGGLQIDGETGLKRHEIIDVLFETLNTRPDNGLGPFRAMLQSLLAWSHFDPYYFDKLRKLDRAVATGNLEHLKQLQEIRDARIKSDRERRATHEAERQQPTVALEDLRAEYLDLLANKTTRQQRGYALERILAELARLSRLETTEAFRVHGEQPSSGSRLSVLLHPADVHVSNPVSLGSIDNAVENVAPSRITLSPAPVEDPRF